MNQQSPNTSKNSSEFDPAITNPLSGISAKLPQNSDGFLGKVMAWLCLAFALAAVGTAVIGPLVPPVMMLPLSLLILGILIASAFARKSAKLAPFLTVVIPMALGILLYPVLDSYFASGSGDIVYMAATGTALVFGLMAVLGWTSKKSLESWSGKLFIVVLSVIGLSLLNVFFFKLTIVSLLISCVILVVFSIYTFIDIQRIKNRTANDPTPAALFALNIFLDIYNIFVSLLNILSIFR